jgi:hypothetical protein
MRCIRHGMAVSENSSNAPISISCVNCLTGDAKQSSVVAWCCNNVGTWRMAVVPHCFSDMQFMTVAQA